MTGVAMLPTPPGTIAVRYLLPPGSDALVTLGAAVAAGDVLAHTPRHPVCVAAPARRGDHPSDSPQVGARVEAGQTVAGRGGGFRAPRVVAPERGTVASVSADGAITITPDGEAVPMHARFPGIVVAVAGGGIVVAVPAQCVRFAYAIGRRDAEIAFDATPELGANAHRGSTRVRLLPFIADHKGLVAALRETRGTLIVGAVEDEVAWEICTKYGDELRGAEHVAVIVLAGPGDAAQGERAVRHLVGLTPHVALVNRVAQTLAVVRDHTETTDAASESAPEGALRDPAHWMARVAPRRVSGLATIEGGSRVWTRTVVSASRGTHEVPTRNLAEIGGNP